MVDHRVGKQEESQGFQLAQMVDASHSEASMCLGESGGTAKVPVVVALKGTVGLWFV